METKAKNTLIKNVTIFDGISDEVITGKDIVLDGNMISEIIPTGSDEAAYELVIDGKGKFDILIPPMMLVRYYRILDYQLRLDERIPRQYCRQLKLLI